jgi:rubrerythrin
VLKQSKPVLKTSALTQTEALLDFSLAEACSGIEMVQAAKLTNNASLAAGFIRHAIDEYRHANIFNNISSTTSVRHGLIGLNRYLTINAYNKKYIDRDTFLFEKKSLGRFSIFVYISEKYAAKHFNSIVTKDSILNKDEEQLIKSILSDEKNHINHAYNSTIKFKSNNKLLYFWFNLLERENQIRRNLQSKMGWFNNRVTMAILFTSMLTLRLLNRTIRVTFSKNKPHFDLNQALFQSHEMI